LAMASFFSATPAFRVVICKSWGVGRAGNTHHGDGYQNGPWWLGKFTHTHGTGRTTWACPHASSMIIDDYCVFFFEYPIYSMYGIFTYIWVIFRANVGKYAIHGSYGYDNLWGIIM
jgi:hypothetical protein